MASPSELSLDMKPHSYSVLLKSFASSGDHHQHQLPELKQLEDFLACLEDERLKIEAFKRELPLCMQLLSNAVETSRQKLHAVKSSNQGSRPVLEEFIPLKSPTADGEADMDTPTKTDKSNWMVSAQLWSQTPNIDNKQNDQASDDQMRLNINSSTLTSLHKTSTGAGAFIPFSKDSNISTEHHLLEDKKLLGSDLVSEYCPSNMISVAGGMTENEPLTATATDCTTLTTSNTTHNNNNTNNNNSSSNNNNQPHRKARRCWSPDLHRKFVNALQMLGGSQVATPKQIRELMKVDGLTNDEVKSHLQKYRLHTRRPSPSPPTQHHQSPGGAPAAQLVVLGGIWVPPEYAAAAAAAHHHHHTNAAALYQPVGPDHQQFVHHHHHHRQQQQQQLFQQIHQQQQMQMQIHQQQQQVQMQAIQVYNKNKAPSSQSSPDARGVSESIEDGKSESGSWKGGESVENGKERVMKGGDDRESEITLKF